MRTLFLGLMLIVVTVFGLSVTAEHPPVGSSSLMTQLLKPGQTVRVDEKEFGFVIRIASSSEENREKPNDYSTVSSVKPNHIVLKYRDGRTQRIATHAIAQITHRAENSMGATKKLHRVLTSHDTSRTSPSDSLELDGGYVETGMNEVSIASTVDDPPGLRLGVRRKKGWGRSLGKLSFNAIRPDRVQDECVLIQGKLDERFPDSDLVGEYIFFLRTPPGGGDEGDMVRVLSLQHDRIVAHVPVVFEQGTNPISDPVR